MVNIFRHINGAGYLIALIAIALSLLASAPFALAQSAAPASSHGQTSTANPGDGKAAPADARIDAAEVEKRVDQELGTDLQATLADWQRQLDLLEKELGRPHLRYSELNEFRSRLQSVRSAVADLASKLQPRLQADKAQMDLFGPAPAAGQPAEPEQTALSRAELPAVRICGHG